MSASDWGQLLLLGALWGGSFFFARIAVAEIPPLALVLYRVSIAALVLHVWLRLRNISFAPAIARSASFLGLALLNNVIPFSLIFSGQTEIGAGLASVLYATTPLWTVLVANLLTADEKLSASKLAGVALGIGGAAIMIGPGLFANLGGPTWAKLAVIGAAISYAFAAVFAKRFRDIKPVVVAAGQLTASTIVMIPIVLLLYDPGEIISTNISIWLAIGTLAIVTTAFAFILYFNLIASAGATNASLVTLLVPASAIILSAAFLGERLEPYEFLGLALIISSLVVVDGRLLRWRQRSDALKKS
ncbi:MULTISPECIES: DMT family transporter [unclassified Rhizobium]|uniref:DMT family transporter n=1 Tax=Rhizobium TaxID=379 RepID=UPI00084C8FD5|nr:MULTISPECIES: DMT family transporter [unclassified Rhizobium]OEC98489.1 ABC transporter permease [Rhizobium sp. YK2]QYA14594.1 DMT family transporter [Rhizobium sp. AB2/73]UEQ82918.1 DMT family transporter [Rhizobium sp. AB2/73]